MRFYDETNHLFMPDTAADGGFFVSGDYHGTDGPYFSILRTDSAGEVMWVHHHRANVMELVPTMIRATPDGGCVAAMLVNNQGTAQQPLIMRVDSAGNELWVKSPDSTGWSSLGGLIALDDGTILFAGTYLSDFCLLALEPETQASDQRTRPLANSFDVLARPNPFNPSTTISLTIPQTARTSVVVYDIMGREVRTLHAGVLERGAHEFAFDGSALPSGLYFAQVTSGTFVATRKLLLLK
ncbi:T9SS type A sorting domain-containing protein [candidate division KSB1 bacterium]|nr:T9SS type A sorting domain-containing protein [candidate division KSB1 bacterium]